MKKLYGLLVAINDYPKPVNKLKGCINDRNQFLDLLKLRYEGLFELHLNELSNEEATRENIIHSFRQFEQAKDGDVCLFFFAGHGSQIKAPPAFSHLEHDSMLETIVCYDSRTVHGRDLINKELSYLIWKTVHGKAIHFLAIMDCCHSGSNTRKERMESTIRSIDDQPTSIKKNDFLGIETYLVGKNGLLTPPHAPHVLLSAALSRETAKEVQADGLPRGVFSYSLIEVLQKANRPVSYIELINRVNLRVRALVQQQTPSLDAVYGSDKNLGFLGQQLSDRPDLYFVSYDTEKGWLVNAGAMDGLLIKDGVANAVFQLVDNLKELQVTAVNFSTSEIEDMDGANIKKVYEAVLVKKEPNNWWLTSPNYGSSFCLPARPGAVAKGFDSSIKAEKVAKWNHLLYLSNPSSTISEDEFLLKLYRITEAGNYNRDAEAEEVAWNKPFFLPYYYHNGIYYKPAFRLKIKNTGYRKLWISALYLDSGFGISNELLPNAELRPGEEKWLEYLSNDYLTNVIQVWIPNNYIQQKIYHIKDYLKIIISADYFLTDDLNQDSLHLNAKRSFGNEVNIPSASWRTEHIELDIQYPFDAG